MARNGTGTMAIINSFSANTTIESAKINANFTDIASEITGSLPRDGKAGMTGQFKSSSGSASAPGMSFASGTTSGFYLISGTEVGAAIGGTKVGSIDSTGFKNATGVKYDAFPSGTKLLFYSDTAPTGWTIQTSSLNDKALRVVSGSAAGGGTGGATGGTTAFTSVFTDRTIAKANLPDYNLSHTLGTVTTGTHNHDISILRGTVQGGTGSATALMSPASSYSTGSVTETTANDGAHNHGITGSIALGGSGTAMDFAVAYASVIIAAKD